MIQLHNKQSGLLNQCAVAEFCFISSSKQLLPFYWPEPEHLHFRGNRMPASHMLTSAILLSSSPGENSVGSRVACARNLAWQRVATRKDTQGRQTAPDSLLARARELALQRTWDARLGHGGLLLQGEIQAMCHFQRKQHGSVSSAGSLTCCFSCWTTTPCFLGFASLLKECNKKLALGVAAK